MQQIARIHSNYPVWCWVCICMHGDMWWGYTDVESRPWGYCVHITNHTYSYNSWVYTLGCIIILAVYFMLILHYTAPSMSTAPLPPPRNGSISDHAVPAIPGTQVTFQCDDGLFPEGIMTATCLFTGKWDKHSGKIVCRGKCIHYLNTLAYTLNHLQLPAYLMGVALM